MEDAPRTVRGEAAVSSGPGGASLALPEPVGRLAPGSAVEGVARGFPFRAPVGADGRSLALSQGLARAVGVTGGGTVPVEITRIGDEPEARVPADLADALDSVPGALKTWSRVTPMARREWVRWVASAKQAQTRSRRIEGACDMLAKGKRRPCCFPGVNWVAKDQVAHHETWLPLPEP